ncbi:heme exporter protein CcmB [Fundidesulfovibrio terrae]|uniref:heme exporter protein CcmB n=1 Tax=Fundidesulfovibrio terrae TaxID=2922866 RepID=UPI001FAF4C68|nr:heme exporter protein CcmB [Fundidesulfovibrio terrae]
MLTSSLRIASKDLRLCLRGAQGLAQTALLGLLVIFVFSLSRKPGEEVPALAAAAIFWLSTLFAQVLVYSGLYNLEEGNGSRLGLAMSPIPPQAVWLGKALAGLALVLCCQVVFAVAVAAFLGQGVAGSPVLGLACVLVVDVGLASLGSLMGALASGKTSRESLLTVIFFPLIIPVLLSGIRVLEGVILGGDAGLDWLGIAVAFAAVFSAAALILFPFIYTGEE